MKETTRATPKHHHLHAVLLLGVVSVFFLLLSTSVTSDDRLIKEINNFGHIILFGIFACVLLYWIKATQRERIHSAGMQYLLTFVVATGIATFTEALQVFGPRSADMVDALRNVLGVTAFLGCYALFDEDLQLTRRLSRGKKALCFMLLLSIPTPALVPVAKELHLAYLMHAQLPVLLDFDEDWEYDLITPHGANIYPLVGGSHNGWARAQFQPKMFASLLFRNFKHSWKAYTMLHIELESEAEQAETLSLLLFSDIYNYKSEAGYQLDAVLQPGANTITFDLREAEEDAQTRKLDLCCVQEIKLFRDREPRQLSIRIKRIYFE
ncbi:MAG: VanZ family protein [Pseudomonadales bacterium]